MTLPEFQACLDRLGVFLAAKDGKLLVDAPLGSMTADLRAELRRHKPALLIHLTAGYVKNVIDMEDARSEAAASAQGERDRCSCGSRDLICLTHFRRCRTCSRDWIVFDPPAPRERPDSAKIAREGDRLREAGLALPLCSLPSDSGAGVGIEQRDRIT
jgi:hypothetical protein